VDEFRPSLGWSDAYARTVAFLIDDVAASQFLLRREAVAVGAPPWFVRRLAAETGGDLVQVADGMDIVYVTETPVVGVGVLDREPLGRFVLQDLLDGCCYRPAFYCHPEVHPACWESLSLAVQEGLRAEIAIELAAMDP
jgi:hypothetical protein